MFELNRREAIGLLASAAATPSGRAPGAPAQPDGRRPRIGVLMELAETDFDGHPSIRATTSADGGGVRQGGSVAISWESHNAPPESAVAIFPEKAATGHIFAAIASALPTSGSFTWQIPVFVMPPVPCAPDITGGCVGSMNPTTYKIVARLYTPVDADLTGFGPGKTYPTWIAWTESNEFTMLAAAP
jgi:hypothetical protein